MRIAIIQFPGSNCERETMLAVQRAGMTPIEFLWNQPTEALTEFSGFIIVGGFSYEDRSRAGIIAALDPLMGVIKQQSQLGKPILGICNGAQILVESGLVPGLANDQVGMTLTDNKRIQSGKMLGTGFYNAWVHMRVSNEFQLNAFTRRLKPSDILSVPVAHAEGRFIIPSGLLAEMQMQGQTVFQYCDEAGAIIDAFPVNPNGSIYNLAAVSNKAGNVMAMMPHPERTLNGDVIFQSMREYIAEGYRQPVVPLHYCPRPQPIEIYQQPKHHDAWLVELIITDNQAMSVETTLRHLGWPVKVTRWIHWDISCHSPDILKSIQSTGILYNPRKEKWVKLPPPKKINSFSFLVQAKEDMLGQQKKQMLEDHFNLSGIHSIRHGVVWQIEAEDMADLAALREHIIHSQILFNPYAHDCYDY